MSNGTTDLPTAPAATVRLILHPNHELFTQLRHPMCPECGREILPWSAVVYEELDDGRYLVKHECCESKEYA